MADRRVALQVFALVDGERPGLCGQTCRFLYNSVGRRVCGLFNKEVRRVGVSAERHEMCLAATVEPRDPKFRHTGKPRSVAPKKAPANPKGDEGKA